MSVITTKVSDRQILERLLNIVGVLYEKITNEELTLYFHDDNGSGENISYHPGKHPNLSANLKKPEV